MKSAHLKKNSSNFLVLPKQEATLCSLWAHPLWIWQISLPLLDCHSYVAGVTIIMAIALYQVEKVDHIYNHRLAKKIRLFRPF